MAYDVEQKAQAIALVRTGTSAAKAAALLNLPERSVQAWVKDFRETAAKEDDPLLNDQSLRIATRSGELIERQLEYIVEMDPETAHKSLFVLNALRGTSLDKMISSHRTDKVTTPVTITFTTRPTDEPAMEAEYRKVPIERRGEPGERSSGT